MSYNMHRYNPLAEAETKNKKDKMCLIHQILGYPSFQNVQMYVL